MSITLSPIRLFALASAVCATMTLPSCAQNTPVRTPPLIAESRTNFSLVPGTVISHSPASSRLFVGSPSIAIMPDGNYRASHDEFGFGIEDTRAISRIFGSSDKGKTWKPLSVINGSFWSSLFFHQGALYLMGTDKQYGRIVIHRSNDSGKTWTTPTNATNGVLRADGKFHCAPVPVIEHKGRLWRAMEDANGPGGWGSHFRAFMMSAPVGADLLNAASWTSSNSLARDASWNGGDFAGWLEGNAVVTPDGKIVDVLRVDTKSPDEKAAIVRISDDGKTASFDPQTGFVNFPGGAKKFTIRFDPKSKLYWSLASIVLPRHRRDVPASIRNTLALISSPDLRSWTTRSILLYHPDVARHGFQYIDWLFEGDDIIYVSRTAYDDGLGGAGNNHDANFLTFHRAKNFRTLTMKDSVPILEPLETRVETADFTLVGSGFEVAKLAVGEKAFSNRAYTWREVPPSFDGGRFTRIAGGEPAILRVKAKRDTQVSVAGVLTLPGFKLDGWQNSGATFRYNDTGNTAFSVFSRAVKAGEEIDIPQTNWAGTLMLLPPIGQ